MILYCDWPTGSSHYLLVILRESVVRWVIIIILYHRWVTYDTVSWVAGQATAITCELDGLFSLYCTIEGLPMILYHR